MANSQPLESIIQDADNVAEDGGSATLKSLIETFGDRAFGPVITLLGLLAMTPFGAVPGIPAVLSAIIVVFTAQILFGKSSPWLPDFVKDIEVKASSITAFQSRARTWLKRIDGILQPRLKWAAGSIARRIAAAIVIVLSLTMVPLEAIPFAVAIPSAVIVLLGIGLTARDGLVLMFGFIASVLAVAAPLLLI